MRGPQLQLEFRLIASISAFCGPVQVSLSGACNEVAVAFKLTIKTLPIFRIHEHGPLEAALVHLSPGPASTLCE